MIVANWDEQETARRLVVAKCDDQKGQLLEDLPVTLSYEITKPSADSTPAKAQAKLKGGNLQRHKRNYQRTVTDASKRGVLL